MDWATHKQKSTATSTAQAEYTALNTVVREVAFLRELVKQVEGIYEPAVICEDNSSAIRIAEGTETTTSRFLLTKFYAIRQAVQEGSVVMKKVASIDQWADIMTKALDKSNFVRIRVFAGISLFDN